MGILEWATNPWGQYVPIHIAWFLIWVSVIGGLLFLIVHATWLRFFARSREFASDASLCCLRLSCRRWESSLIG